jgi:D-arabinose 1-dehydrogenase-like Zn-dependent alcohol dehydrogenase
MSRSVDQGDLGGCQALIADFYDALGGHHEVTPAQLCFGSRSIEGALTGSAIDNEDTLAFSALENVRPMIETVPLEKAADAYGRMLRNEARFRMVLLTGQ